MALYLYDIQIPIDTLQIYFTIIIMISTAVLVMHTILTKFQFSFPYSIFLSLFLFPLSFLQTISLHTSTLDFKFLLLLYFVNSLHHYIQLSMASTFNFKFNHLFVKPSNHSSIQYRYDVVRSVVIQRTRESMLFVVSSSTFVIVSLPFFFIRIIVYHYIVLPLFKGLLNFNEMHID